MIRIDSDNKKLFKIYEPLILSAVKKYMLERVNLKIKISDKIYGGKISRVGFDVRLRNNSFFGKATVCFGRPQRNDSYWSKALVFHELGHVIVFSKINSSDDIKVKIRMVSDGFIVEPLLASNMWWLPWLELVSEALSCRFGGRGVEKLVFNRTFEYWKWWKNRKAFFMVKNEIRKSLKEIKDKNVFSSLDYLLNERHENTGRKIYETMVAYPKKLTS